MCKSLTNCVGYDKLLLHEKVIFVIGVTVIQKEQTKSQKELVWVDLMAPKLCTKYALLQNRISMEHSLLCILLAHNYSHHSAFSASHCVTITVILQCQRVTQKLSGQCDNSNKTVQLSSQMRKKQWINIVQLRYEKWHKIKH